MTRKQFFLILSIFLLSTAMVFGGGTQESSQVADGPTEIIFYMWEDPTYIDIVDAFNASQDEVRVNAQVLPNADYETRLTTLLSGGAQMDAFMQKRQPDIFAHNAAGHIHPLDDLIDQFEYDFDAVGSYESALKIGGKTLAIPFRGATTYTYFNKSLFDAYGVPYPTEYVERGEWTWDKYVEVAEQVTGPDNYGALVFRWGDMHTFPAYQHGRQIITPDGKIDIDESVLQFFKIRKEMEAAGTMYPLLELLSSRTHYSTIFFQNDAAMMFMGEWFPGMVKTADEEGDLGFDWDQWGVTRLPCDTVDYSSYGLPTFNHVHARSQNKEAAFKFISWMGSAAGATEVAKGGFLPPMMNDEIRQVLSDSLPDQQSLAYFTEGPRVFPQFYNKYGSRAKSLMGDLMQEYLTQDLTDEEFMTRMRRGLQEIIDTTN